MPKKRKLTQIIKNLRKETNRLMNSKIIIPWGDVAKAEEKYNENFNISTNNSNFYQYFKLKEEKIYVSMGKLKNIQV